MRKLAFILALSLIVFPGLASALGLGNIEISSALNEPLRARIALLSLQSGDAESMFVSIGSTEQFQRAGLDRPFVLSGLRFKTVETAAGSGYIDVSTRDPVSEPFLNFLIEVNWPRGRVIREYTVLLDPPIYGAAITLNVEQAVATVKNAPSLTGSGTEATGSVSTMSASEAPVAKQPAMAQSAAMSGEYGPVTATDTLWSLSQSLRPSSDVSVQGMMLALLKANPQAFSIDNINALKAGAILRVPSAEELGSENKAAVLAEVRRQHTLWQEYRQSLGIAVPTAADGTVEASEASGQSGEASTMAQPAASVSENAVLELVSDGSGSKGVGTGGDVADAAALRDQLSLALEEADTKVRENEEFASRLDDAEQIISDLQRMVELKDDEIAALQQLSGAEAMPSEAQQLTPEPTPEPEPAPQPESVATPTPAVPQPAPAATSTAVVPQPEPQPMSTLDLVLGFLPFDIKALPINPLVLIAALGGLLVLGGGVALFRRRRATAGDDDEAAVSVPRSGSLIEQYAATELPDRSPDDVTEVPGSSTIADDSDKTVLASVAAEDDPLAEVNVYLSYERYDQAEELVCGAIQQYPDRDEYKEKLLEVFYSAKDLPKFEEAARVLLAAVGEDSPLMERAAGLWQEMSPGRDLFAPPTQASLDAGGSAQDLDATGDVFDVTGGDAPIDFGTGEDVDSGSVDFDLGFEFTSADEDGTTGEGGVDFDLGAGSDDATETSNGLELDFDLGAGDDATPSSAAGSNDGELDFDIGFESADEVESAGDGGDLGVDFDLGGDEFDSPVETVVAGDGRPSGLADTAEVVASETGLDFDLGGDDELSLPNGDAVTDAGAGDSELDFDLGGDDELSLPDDEVASDAGAGDSELDFDLGGDDELSLPDGEVAPDAGAGDSELDFDLSGDDELSVPDDVTALSADVGAVDSELDFDLGGDVELTAPSADEAAASSGELESGSEDFGLNLGVGAQGTIADTSGDDAEIEFDIGGDDALATTGDDLDFSLDFDEEVAGAEEPDMGLQTVQLKPGQAADLMAAAETGLALSSEEGGQSSVDADFEDIFGDELTEDGALDDDMLGESALDLDFDLGGAEETAEPESVIDDEDEKTVFLGGDLDGDVDEVQTKLDLAQAYADMGDQEGARGILAEVIAEGSSSQQETAKAILANLG